MTDAEPAPIGMAQLQVNVKRHSQVIVLTSFLITCYRLCLLSLGQYIIFYLLQVVQGYGTSNYMVSSAETLLL